MIGYLGEESSKSCNSGRTCISHLAGLEQVGEDNYFRDSLHLDALDFGPSIPEGEPPYRYKGLQANKTRKHSSRHVLPLSLQDLGLFSSQGGLLP